MTTKAINGKSAASAGLAALAVGLWAYARVPALAVLPLAAAAFALGVLGLRDIARGEGRIGGRWFALGGIFGAAPRCWSSWSSCPPSITCRTRPAAWSRPET